MNRLSVLACLLLATSLPLVAGATTPTTPQQRMAECSAKNKGMKGDAYKQAQRACLSGTSSAATTPQQRMTRCNADAATQNLTGEARKAFMSNCLKAR